MKVTLKLPRLGMNMMEGTVTRWRLEDGAAFEKGEALYEVETDKVSTEVEAPSAGRLLSRLVEAGDTVDVGTPLCVIEADSS